MTKPMPLLPLAADKPAAARVPASTRIALPWLAAALMAVAVLLAALLTWGLATALGGAAAWQAPLAAALAVAGASIPAAALLLRLQREAAGGAPVCGGVNGPVGATRAVFLELAGREWARARRYGSGAALLLVDVDRFARLVESRGGVVTDAVLAEMLRQTAPTLRGADLLTRFSESQMAVFLSHADATGALDVAERIRERTEQMAMPLQREASSRNLRVTVSVGVSQLRPAHLNLQALVDDAQEAVYAARQAGGNCVRAAPVDGTQLNAAGPWLDDHRARPK